MRIAVLALASLLVAAQAQAATSPGGPAAVAGAKDPLAKAKEMQLWDGVHPLTGLTMDETRQLLPLRVKAMEILKIGQFTVVGHGPTPADEVKALGADGPTYARLMNKNLQAMYEAGTAAFKRAGGRQFRGATGEAARAALDAAAPGATAIEYLPQKDGSIILKVHAPDPPDLYPVAR